MSRKTLRAKPYRINNEKPYDKLDGFVRLSLDMDAGGTMVNTLRCTVEHWWQTAQGEQELARRKREGHLPPRCLLTPEDQVELLRAQAGWWRDAAARTRDLLRYRRGLSPADLPQTFASSTGKEVRHWMERGGADLERQDEAIAAGYDKQADDLAREHGIDSPPRQPASEVERAAQWRAKAAQERSKAEGAMARRQAERLASMYEAIADQVESVAAPVLH